MQEFVLKVLAFLWKMAGYDGTFFRCEEGVKEPQRFENQLRISVNRQNSSVVLKKNSGKKKEEVCEVLECFLFSLFIYLWCMEGRVM